MVVVPYSSLSNVRGGISFQGITSERRTPEDSSKDSRMYSSDFRSHFNDLDHVSEFIEHISLVIFRIHS